MASDHVTAMSHRLADIRQQGKFQNFVAQAHSRDILRYLQVPPEKWPAYTDSLDDDLNYTAHYLLYQGLELRNQPGTAAESDAHLTLGAEILEYLHTRAGAGDPERVCQIFTAALAYYIAGHFARAFVLIRDLEASVPLPGYLRPLRHLLMKDFGRLRGEIFGLLLNPEYADTRIAEHVAAGAMDEDQAVSRILEATLCRALSFFLEYAKTGIDGLLATADHMLEQGIRLAIETRFVDWWWFLSCVRALLRSYQAHSLWTNLAPYLGNPAARHLSVRYIRGNYRRPIPIIELWPSQVTAVPMLADSATGRKNLCLRMPTSAGKTKVAELAILDLLAAHLSPDVKCMYVAPFRSLAVEIEQTLKQAFMPLGVRVSELYGGFELTLSEKLLIEKTQVLVATPEKMDAFLRFNPELAAQIKLVILDEGHIISPPNLRWIRQSRGLKYEVFLQRLLNRYEQTETRILFLSAVMPNAEQFAEWITGDPKGTVHSDWRPSRLMLGELTWTGDRVDLDFTHADHQPLGHRCFVHRFVGQVTPEELPDRRRKAPFPDDAAEALALAALEFAQKGMTMIFVARKASVEPLGRKVLACIHLLRRLAERRGASYGLPRPTNLRTHLDKCARLIRETMGSDSPIAEFLNEGFVVHHGSLPHPVRFELEKLVRSGDIRLVIATTTLAQGVNFPVHTVIVHSLDHGQRELVSPMDFWNICGRAGRGMKENEGQVLFFVQKYFDEWRNAPFRKWLQRYNSAGQERRWQEWLEEQAAVRQRYVDSYGAYSVQSALRKVLVTIWQLWKQAHETVDVAELCEALANHTLDLFAPSEEIDLESLLSTLDGLILAVTEERENEEITPDDFQDIFKRSLLHLQLDSEKSRDTVHRMLHARVRYVHSKYPQRRDRQRLYRLGLPLQDCEQIEAARETLLELYRSAADFDNWTAEQRSDHLAEIAAFLLNLSEITPDSELPEYWRRVLFLWLTGITPDEMVNDPELSPHSSSPAAISRLIDDLCTYRLPWGFNSLGIYLEGAADEVGQALPEVCGYYSAMVKYGVHDPTACWLLTFGVTSRRVAVRAAQILAGAFSRPEALLGWLLSGGVAYLASAGLTAEEVRVLEEALVGLDYDPTKAGKVPGSRRINIKSSARAARLVEVQDRLLIRPGSPDSGRSFALFTLMGELLGRYTLTSGQPLANLDHPEQLDVFVEQVSATNGTCTMTVRLELV
jgi:Lhr-like helicase